jgi:class 3 adenylate cyclase/tetratricopeptide (TPR) repeat protein
VLVCPSCEAVNEVAFDFCGSCGSRLEMFDPSPSLREERRIATVLFADLSGFTSMSERLDPEEVKAIGSYVTGRMGEQVIRFGGTVVNVLGDGIMAVFGAPIAHEDDAERAVRCALEMAATISPPADSSIDGSVHVGINTGEVMAGIVGPPEHREYAVMGDVTNTAARLEAAAKGGQVVVGAGTCEVTRDAIDYTELEPITAKGKREPVAAWLALRARGVPATRRVSTAPFVGRETQLGLLRNIWEETRAGSKPHLLTLLGGPGLGKSRLVHEFVAGLDPSIAVLRGRSLPYGEATGYDAFIQVVRAAAGIGEADPVETASDKLARCVRRLIPDAVADRTFGHLSVLVGLSSEAASDRQRLFDSARSFLEATGREAPTALVFEDLHWAAPSMIALVEFLATHLRDTALLILTTARPELLEARPSWASGLPRYLAVDLEPLDEREARRLALSLLQSVDDAPALDRLVEAGGGNPLFLEEFAASVVERTADPGASLPATVQGVIAARIDSLPARDRDTLLSASVVGRVFARGTLEALAGGSVDDALEMLERRGFIRLERGSEPSSNPRFVFKHILTSDVAYQILPKRARPALHAAVAAHLETSSGDRIRDEAAVIARHWRLAGEEDRALPLLLLAADGASRTWAKERAIELYGDVLDILGDDGDRDATERALLGRAQALLASNEFGPAAQLDIELLMTSEIQATRALATELRARLAYWSGDAASALRFGEDALAQAGGMYDVAISSRALGLLGEIRAMEGDLDEAERLSLRGVTEWPEDARDGNYAYTCTMLGLVHYWRGEYADAVRWAETGYRMGVETSHLGATVQGAAQASLALAGSCRYEESLEWIERAVTAGREWEPKPQLTSRAVNIWAATLREIGDLEGARRLNHEAEELARSATFPGARISAGIDLLTLDLLEGNVREASLRLPGLLEEAEGTKGWHQWLFGGRLAEAQARIELLSGHPKEAAVAAGQSLELARSRGRRKYVCRSLVTLGDALLALNRVAEAESAMREALGVAEVLGHAPSLWATAQGLADVLDRTERGEDASACRAVAEGAVTAVALSLSDDHRAMFLNRIEGPGG